MVGKVFFEVNVDPVSSVSIDNAHAKGDPIVEGRGGFSVVEFGTGLKGERLPGGADMLGGETHQLYWPGGER